VTDPAGTEVELARAEVAGGETLAIAAVPEVNQHGIPLWARRRLRQDLSNWRLFLVRVVTSGLAVIVTVALVPGLGFASFGWGSFTLIGLVFGLLNGLVKPFLQFFSLRYLVASYGLVVVLINALLLGLLSWILDGKIEARSVLSFLVGGLLIGLIGTFLDTLAGTTPPILDRKRAP
jgi:putative membrane protein